MKKKVELIYSALVFIILFVVYMLTLAPVVSFTDSGELAAVVSSLGIAHPTGYPLFTIIGYIWTLIPLPLSNIVKLNILTALFSAASSAVFFHTFILIGKNILQNLNIAQKKIKSDELPIDNHSNILRFTSFILALSLGFSMVIWQSSVTIEVYSLHFLLMNISMYLLVKAYYQSDIKYFIAAALFIGLGFSNHMTTLLITPAWLFLFFKNKDKGFDFSPARVKQYLISLIPFAIGLSVYLYLPLRSSMDPMLDWGDVSRNFDKLFYHVSGKQYQVWMFSGFDSWTENFNKFFSAFPYVFGVLLIIPFIYAAFKASVRKEKIKWILSLPIAPISVPFSKMLGQSRNIFYLLIIMILSGTAYSFNYSIHDIEPYFYSAFWAIFVLLGVAMLHLAIDSPKELYTFLMAPLMLLMLNYNECDMSNDYSVEDYTRIMVDNLPENAIIISSQWDYWCSAFWYLQHIENYRPDVVLIEKELFRRTWKPTMFARWYPHIAEKSKPETDRFLKDLEVFESGGNYNPMSIQQNFVALFNSYIDKNIDSIDVFITPDVLQSDPDIGKKYFKLSVGFAVKLSKTNDTIAILTDNIDITRFEKSVIGKKGHLHNGIRQTAAWNFLNISRYAQSTGQIEEARKAIEKARQLDKDNPDINSFWRELAIDR